MSPNTPNDSTIDGASNAKANTYKGINTDVKCFFDPKVEKAACGVGFIVQIDAIASHKLLQDAKTLSARMEHRGACACDNLTGDGAGIVVSIPHDFYAQELKEKENIELPEKGKYATGIYFLDKKTAPLAEKRFGELAIEHGLKVIHWRTVPTDPSCLGEVALSTEPFCRQVFVQANEEFDKAEFEKRLYILRKFSTHTLQGEGLRFYICSLSTATIVYKGQFTPGQLWPYFIDLNQPNFQCYLALVHARFSTNTFPSWDRAHPLRYVAHNGEINTLRGNVNLMRAREGRMKSSKFGNENLTKLYPVVEADMSDSGSLDNVLEFLVHAGGRQLPEAVMTMVPEAWQHDKTMNEDKKNFYKWAGTVLEPWDGPALLTFTDGKFVGAILDRNGLRPARYCLTSDNILVMASEVGVVDFEDEKVILKSRLKPGRMLLIDTEQRKLVSDVEIKEQIASQQPYGTWVKEIFTLADLRAINNKQPACAHNPTLQRLEAGLLRRGDSLSGRAKVLQDRRLALFAYTTETLNFLLLPMIRTQKEALGSMGNDSPLACLSLREPLIYDYFKQLFAQVTNPPIDPFREKIVMSLSTPIGPEGNLLEPCREHCQRLWLDQPILSISDLQLLKETDYKGWKTRTIDIVFPVENGPEGLVKAIDFVCEQAYEAAVDNNTVIVLSDRKAGPKSVPISAPLAVGAVHHYLIEKRQRLKCALILETGEARLVHHLAVLLGYGLDALCPYLVFETACNLREEGLLQLSDKDVYQNYVLASERGLSKVMAKMGISTLQSYKHAQIFEIVGLSQEVVNKCFKNSVSRVGGVTFEVLAKEAYERHGNAYNPQYTYDSLILRNPGFYHWRSGGEKHINDPLAIANLQDAARSNSPQAYKEFVKITMEANRNCTLRGQLELNYGLKSPVPIEEVESVVNIVKRFVTGAMSFGSISLEAHTTLAVAMNHIGGKSNTGEGGEDSNRWIVPKKPDDFDIRKSKPINNQRSAIKQVASGRFGVTAAYLANSDELQIKMAQGAKPGEGGELPGHKVTGDIAKTRHSIAGVGLISPPPHHDIYSIEDLSQLIYDLKCSNPEARISVKLVSENGVGIVASGVAKSKAEHIVISGHDGGTGASSWTGIKGAGVSWELGISETHQTLVANDLRSRVILQVDGQIRTAFDVICAAALGGDEFGFSTAPLIVLGCTMMRKCHLNTCPVGIATQDPELRKKFEGKPEHLINYLFLLGEEIREEMAKLGVRKFQELIGETGFLKVRPNEINPKANMLDFSGILCNALTIRPGTNIVGGSIKQNFELEKRKDNQIIEQSSKLIEQIAQLKQSDQPIDYTKIEPVKIEMKIVNQDRAFATTLSYEIAKRFGEPGLGGDNLIQIKLKGSAGQSLGAFLSRGVSIELEGDSNDYLGKGLCGGEIVVYPPKKAPADFKSELNVIIGNVCLYGATSGKVYVRGIASERFAVRNSGAQAILEGAGDHCCEYMTGGKVVVLGKTGRNFAAGMSGGIAYVYDPIDDFFPKCNHETVDLFSVEDEDDIEFLREALTTFVQKTDSEIAKNILDKFDEELSNFFKVFPKEYQRALKQLAIKTTKREIQREKSDAIAENAKKIKDIEDSIIDPATLDKVKGFMKYKRIKGYYRDPRKRMRDFDEIYDYKAIKDNVRIQSARCMECGVPFCQSSHGCPLGNIIPRWNDLVFKNDWQEAINQLLQTNNFPEFTGRVCPAPCEGACVLGINEPPVAIKVIELSIIEEAFQRGWIRANPPAQRNGKKIAVIGSGPAGLAAAHQLNKSGYHVTVYERNDRVGGLLQYGIPTMKLNKKVIERRINIMAEEGIEFNCGINVGVDVTGQFLLQTFDSICLALGATWPRDLKIPGRELKGIHFAMEFLESWQKDTHYSKVVEDEIEGNKMQGINTNGKRVIVLGGGDTSTDCVGTSIRQGAASVISFEILPEPKESRQGDNPWPTWPKIYRIDYGHEEVRTKFGKDPRLFCTSCKEFIGDENGNLKALKAVNVEWTKDEKGNWKLNEIEGSEQTFEVDYVFLAMGFLGPETYLMDQLGLEKDSRGNIKTKSQCYRGSQPKVFACGDCRRGQSLVVHAINEGRQAAREIDASFNNGRSSLPGPGGILPYPPVGSRSKDCCSEC